ncbi:MAG: hypothetical protein HQ579_06575 [Candidatus Omnitrophica bacterium]|nr:hypothetical protein [Candidatus Omnitrophota bacterium]
MKSIAWNSRLAYAIGLITADGSLSIDKRHITFVSKDKDLIETFKECLGIKNKISLKTSGYAKDKEKKYYVVQFGNVKLYNFLTDIGLSPNKSKSIKALLIPPVYFADFLRGIIDGDGCIDYFLHPESKRKQFRIRITSGSKYFLEWLKKILTMRLNIKGSIGNIARAYQLKYYKSDSYRIAGFIYYSPKVAYLKRKFEKAKLMNEREWRNWQTLTA